MLNEKTIKSRSERGFVAWFKRWFLCGYREERRLMKIYLEISQSGDEDIWRGEI